MRKYFLDWKPKFEINNNEISIMSIPSLLRALTVVQIYDIKFFENLIMGHIENINLCSNVDLYLLIDSIMLCVE